MAKLLDKAIQYSLYLLVFLFPLWFLPWTISPVVLNKQLLLAVFVFIVLIFWLIKIIIAGKVSFVWNKLNIAILFLLLILALSTLFSLSRLQSFWGMNFEPDTLFNFILYGLVFFLFANLSSENQRASVVISFLAGSGILTLLFFLQDIFKIFPWGFAQISGFNPIGSVQALSVFLGGAFVILVSLITAEKSASNQRINPRQISGIILGILLFVSIFLINFWVSWLLLAFSLALILKTKFSSRQFFLPLILLILALIFISIKPPANILKLPVEVSPDYKATFDIAIKTLKEGPENFIFGSGPGTFGYQYSLHRGTGPNLTDFWQIRFSQGAAALPTFLATFGILGILAILLMMGIFFWQGFKNLISGNQLSSAAISSFIGGFYFFLSWFLYPLNFSFAFTSFLMLGLFTAASSKRMREFSFTQSSQKAFFITLVCVILIVGSVLGLYKVFQNYLGALNYAKGVSLIMAEKPDLNEGLKKINQATVLDKNRDIYFRDLSQAFLLKINEVLAAPDLTPSERQAELQKQISNAEISALSAAKINPANSQNWFQLALVYENLALINIAGAKELAIINYEKAEKLDPKNPQIPFNLARIYFASEQKEEAKKELQKSLELKSNFQPAIDLLKQIR